MASFAGIAPVWSVSVIGLLFLKLKVCRYLLPANSGWQWSREAPAEGLHACFCVWRRLDALDRRAGRSSRLTSPGGPSGFAFGRRGGLLLIGSRFGSPDGPAEFDGPVASPVAGSHRLEALQVVMPIRVGGRRLGLNFLPQADYHSTDDGSSMMRSAPLCTTMWTRSSASSKSYSRTKGVRRTL
jgi:hypothetical protein